MSRVVILVMGCLFKEFAAVFRGFRAFRSMEIHVACMTALEPYEGGVLGRLFAGFLIAASWLILHLFVTATIRDGDSFCMPPAILQLLLEDLWQWYA